MFIMQSEHRFIHFIPVPVSARQDVRGDVLFFLHKEVTAIGEDH